MSTKRLDGFSMILQPRNKTKARNQIALFLFLHIFNKPPLLLSKEKDPFFTHRMIMVFKRQNKNDNTKSSKRVGTRQWLLKV